MSQVINFTPPDENPFTPVPLNIPNYGTRANQALAESRPNAP